MLNLGQVYSAPRCVHNAARRSWANRETCIDQSFEVSIHLMFGTETAVLGFQLPHPEVEIL